MRFFIALEIPEESRQEILDLQNEVALIIPGIRVAHPNKLHLTIAFTGERDDSVKDDIIRVLKEAAADIPPFEVSPGFIDAFPELHNPKILWLGVKGDVDKLVIIRERVKDKLTKMNLLMDERRYTPHIAIGKIENYSLSEEAEQKLQKLMLKKFAPIKITSLKLFESVPEGGFHTHNTLAEIPLVSS